MALKEKQRWHKQYISDAECFELVWKRPRGDVDSSRSHTLSSLSAKKITEWGRGACWSFPRWWQDGLWDVSFLHPTSLRLIWRRQSGSVKKNQKKTVMGMSQPRATLSLCVCAEPRPGDSRAASWQFLLQSETDGRQKPGEVWVYLGIRHCSGLQLHNFPCAEAHEVRGRVQLSHSKCNTDTEEL